MCTHCVVLFVVREVEEGYRGMMLLTPPPHTTYSCTCFGLGGGMGACFIHARGCICHQVRECVGRGAWFFALCYFGNACLFWFTCVHVFDSFLVCVCVCVYTCTEHCLLDLTRAHLSSYDADS